MSLGSSGGVQLRAGLALQQGDAYLRLAGPGQVYERRGQGSHHAGDDIDDEFTCSTNHRRSASAIGHATGYGTDTGYVDHESTYVDSAFRDHRSRQGVPAFGRLQGRVLLHQLVVVSSRDRPLPSRTHRSHPVHAHRVRFRGAGLFRAGDQGARLLGGLR